MVGNVAEPTMSFPLAPDLFRVVFVGFEVLVGHTKQLSSILAQKALGRLKIVSESKTRTPAELDDHAK